MINGTAEHPEAADVPEPVYLYNSVESYVNRVGHTYLIFGVTEQGPGVGSPKPLMPGGIRPK